MILASDGSIDDRALVNPDRNNFGPRLGFAYTLTPATVIRGGYGVSYVHFSRAGGGDILPINGPQVVNAVVNQTEPTAPTFLPGERGYPAGLADPSQFNPLTANITYMPRGLPLEPGAELVRLGAARAAAQHAARRRLRRQPRRRPAALRQLQPGVRRTTPPGRSRCRIAGRIPSFADITYAFNGGKSRYKALQTKFEWRMSRDADAAQLADAVGDEGQRRAVARELERQLPGAAGLPQPRRRLRPVELPPAVQQHDELRVVAAVRPRPAAGARDASPLLDALIGGWQLAGHQHGLRRRAGDVHLRAGRDRSVVSGIAQDFRGANNYRPNVTCDPLAPRRRAHDHQLVQPRLRDGADRSEPAVRQRGTQHRARAELLAVRSRGVEAVRARRDRPSSSSGFEAFNLLNRTNFRAPNGNRSAGGFGTITATYDPRQLQLGVKLLW